MNRSSSPLVSRVPATITKGSPTSGLVSGPGPETRRLSAAARAGREIVLACASMRDAGTGCDQRVGTAGFEM
jgi:hypothetical protein